MWFIALAFLGVGTVSAQTETAEGTSPWTREGNLGLKLTQVSLTNWAAGGDNSVAFDFQGAYQAKKLVCQCICYFPDAILARI